MKTRMTIGTKLMISVGSLLLMVLALAGASLYSIGVLDSELDKSGKVTARKVDIAGEMASETNKLRVCFRGMILFSMADDRARAQANNEAVEATLASLNQLTAEIKPLIVTALARAQIATIESKMPLVASLGRQIRELCAAGKSKEGLAILLQQAIPVVDEVEKATTEIKAIQRENLKSSVEEGDRKTFLARTTAWTLGLLALVVGGIVVKVILGMTKSLQHAASELAEGAGQIASASTQVSSSSQSLAQGSSEQAASLEETSASTEEITSMTRKNAENSQSAASVMTTVDQHVRQGNRTLEQMVVSMHEINASSDKISKIIKVIDEIAFQTNILALNAAVEAARAGEAGMGFAVVADEVRNLAQRSAQAAKDTAALIEESIAKSNEGSSKLQQVTEVIRAITESSAQVKALVDEVNLGSQEQARGIEQISKAVAQMDQVTQSTAANAEESASASEELSAQAEALNQIVIQLRTMVGGQEAAPVTQQRRTVASANRTKGKTAKPAPTRSRPVNAEIPVAVASKPDRSSFPLEDHFTEM